MTDGLIDLRESLNCSSYLPLRQFENLEENISLTGADATAADYLALDTTPFHVGQFTLMAVDVFLRSGATRMHRSSLPERCLFPVNMFHMYQSDVKHPKAFREV